MRTSEKKRARPINLEDFGRRMDDEIEEFIRWFNDDAVPSIRQHSSRAVRKAATKLAEFADYMDDLKARK